MSQPPLHGSSSAGQPRGGWPLGLPALAAVAMGCLAWFWFLPGAAGLLLTRPAMMQGQLDQVAPADVTAALGTVSGSADFLAQFKARQNQCGMPLAWVSLAGAPAGGAEEIRVKSGDYVSPGFAPQAGPTRIAIPYPAPYEDGSGVLTLISEGSGAVVALAPAVAVPAGAREVVLPVVWPAGAPCRSP